MTMRPGGEEGIQDGRPEAVIASSGTPGRNVAPPPFSVSAPRGAGGFSRVSLRVRLAGGMVSSAMWA